jgi:protein tyrosine phosphatase
MVVEQNVTLIISVCKLEEGGRAKCHKYWPQGKQSEDGSFGKLIFSGLTVNLVSEKNLGPTLVERMIEISTPDGAKHIAR